MSSFRIAILLLLIVALAVLGLIYVKMSDRMDLLQQQAAAPSVGPVSGGQSPYLPMPAPAASDPAVASVVRDPVVEEELAHARKEMERLKKDNEALQHQRMVLGQEKDIMERRDQDKNDPRLRWMNEIRDAELAGRVTEYYRDANLVLFQSIGNPQLKVGQELGIRRRNGIFATLIVDGVDSDGKTYQAYIKRNQLVDGNSKEPLSVGEEVIIPPASWQEDISEAGSSDATAVPPVSAQPAASPAGAPAPAAPEPFVVPLEP